MVNDVATVPPGFLPVLFPESSVLRWGALLVGKKAAHLFNTQRFRGCRYLVWGLADTSGMGRKATSQED